MRQETALAAVDDKVPAEFVEILALLERFGGRECGKVAVLGPEHQRDLSEHNLFKLHDFHGILVDLVLNVNVYETVEEVGLVFHAANVGGYGVFEFVNGRAVENLVSVAPANVDTDRALGVQDKLDGVGRFQEDRNSALQQVVERLNVMLRDWVQSGFVVHPAHVARCLDAH